MICFTLLLATKFTNIGKIYISIALYIWPALFSVTLFLFPEYMSALLYIWLVNNDKNSNKIFPYHGLYSFHNELCLQEYSVEKNGSANKELPHGQLCYDYNKMIVSWTTIKLYTFQVFIIYIFRLIVWVYSSKFIVLKHLQMKLMWREDGY